MAPAIVCPEKYIICQPGWKIVLIGCILCMIASLVIENFCPSYDEETKQRCYKVHGFVNTSLALSVVLALLVNKGAPLSDLWKHDAPAASAAPVVAGK